jgi:hypothetical protein
VNRPARPGLGGFTLFETLLALALTVVLMGATFAFLYGLGDRRTALLNRARADRGVANLLERLEADLLCCCAGDAITGPGIQGEKRSLAVLGRGVDLDERPHGVKTSDLIRSRIDFDEKSGVVLYSREPFLVSEKTNATPEPIASGIANIVFRYFDGRDWRTTHDSIATGGLPSAVEITIWLGVPASEARERPVPDYMRVIVIADAPPAAGEGDGDDS